MSHYSEVLTSEIQLANDECCIIFDFGCYFPYSDFEVLVFDFTLGMKQFDDYKINHRYPNNNYQTISRKYGRKVSKIGYPYVMKLSEQSTMLLCLKIGIRDDYFNLVFPVQTKMTKDKPVCALTLRYMFDKDEFYFMSYKKSGNGRYNQHIWRNYIEENRMNRGNDHEILLNIPNRVGVDGTMLVFGDVIEPHSSSLQDFIIG